MKASDANKLTQEAYNLRKRVILQTIYQSIEKEAKRGLAQLVIDGSEIPDVTNLIVSQLIEDGFKVQVYRGINRDTTNTDRLTITWVENTKISLNDLSDVEMMGG